MAEMTDEELDKAADAEWQREISSTTPEMREVAMDAAVRAFQSSIGEQGGDVTDFLAACQMLSHALGEFHARLEDTLPSLPNEIN